MSEPHEACKAAAKEIWANCNPPGQFRHKSFADSYAAIIEERTNYSALVAENERLKALRGVPPDEWAAMNEAIASAKKRLNEADEYIEDLKAERDRHKAALEKYGQHTQDCPHYTVFGQLNHKCTCGYDQALRGEGDGKE